MSTILFLKARDQHDSRTRDMFGDHVETRTRKDGVVQKYHVSAKHPIGDLYHGTAVKFDKFDMSRAGSGVGYNDQGSGIYMTKDPKLARYFAREARVSHAFHQRELPPRDGGFILNAQLKPDAKILDVNGDSADAKRVKQAMQSVGTADKLHELVLSMGYDGIIMVEPRLEGIEGWEVDRDAKTVVVYNPDAVDVVGGAPSSYGTMAKAIFFRRSR